MFALAVSSKARGGTSAAKNSVPKPPPSVESTADLARLTEFVKNLAPLVKANKPRQQRKRVIDSESSSEEEEKPLPYFGPGTWRSTVPKPEDAMKKRDDDASQPRPQGRSRPRGSGDARCEGHNVHLRLEILPGTDVV